MSDWNTELERFFEGREQQDSSAKERLADEMVAASEFIATVAAPAFEAFDVALQKHGRHVRVRQGDASIRIFVEYAGTEEFDFTLWGGQNSLSTESRTGGRRTLGGFHNTKGTNLLADTTQEDVAQYLTDTYTALNSGTNS